MAILINKISANVWMDMILKASHVLSVKLVSTIHGN